MAAKAKCTSAGCPQAVFRDGLCVDHFRTQKPGASESRLVAAATEEKITDEVRNKFKGVTRNNYVDQAKWYLNAFWADGSEGQAEEVWTIAQKFIELDPKKKAGNELDPVMSSHYLQGINKAMTALELKEALRRIDVDANGLMAVLEYLLFKYARSVVACINNPQGGTEEDLRKLKEAEAKCLELQQALDDLQVQLARQKEDERKALAAEKAAKRAEEEAKAAEAEARSAERIAKEAEAAAKAAEAVAKEAEGKARAQEDILRKAEDVVRAAEAEARAADAELKRQQDELASKQKALEAKIANPSTGAVAKGQAVQELAQLKGADPLPLRKAKITQEAAVRKVEAERKVAEGERKKAQAVREKAEEERKKAVSERQRAEAVRAEAVSKREIAEEERKKAEGEREIAVAARQQAEEQTKRVEEAVADTEQKAREANDYLEELKKRPTVAHGSVWWMQRQIAEARKYMPRSKQ